MANIFDGLKLLTDDEIRLQIAILKNVTLYNSFMETGTRVVNRFISTAGNFLASFRAEDKGDDSELINIKIIKVEDRIHQTQSEMSGYARGTLNDLLKKDLMDKLSLSVDADGNMPSEELIYVRTVRYAAAAYGIDDRQPPSMLADQVKEQYRKHLLRVLQDRLVRENEKKRNQTDGACTLALRTVPIERLRDMNRELQLREFNPKSIMAAVRADKTVYTLERLVSVIGFDAFGLEECVIRTVNDGLKSLIPADRLLLANLTWTAAQRYGKKFAVDRDVLPSFSSNGRSNGVSEVDVRYMESVRKSSELEQEMNRILSEISKSHGRQVELENELLQARLDYDESVFALETAKDQYDDAVHEGNLTRIALDDYEKAHPRADRTSVEYRQQKSRFETAAAKVRDAQYELERSRKKSDRLGKKVEDIRHKSSELDQKIIQLDDSLFEITEEYNEAIFFVDDETLYRSLKLEHHWKKFFSSLHFDKKLFEDVVKLFRTSELHALEFYVQELDAAADSEAFCHEKITGTDETECIARCQVAAGKYAVIRYKGKTIKSITIKDR